MAISVSELTNTAIVYDADSNEVAENDVRAGACTLYGMYADNSAVDELAYVKFYDSAAPTVGTTAPDFILMLEKNADNDVNEGEMFMVFNGGTGISFNNLSFATVTTGGTAGVTTPTGTVKIALITS